VAQIDIRRKHGSSLKDAKAAVDKTARAIAKKFQITHEWEGNTLHFQRGGVDGHIDVNKAEVHVRAELGFLFGMMKPMIEEEINKQLDKNFG
jgi:putative polyhydroxyalkanoate system protein